MSKLAKPQYILLTIAALLFVVFYFVLDTKPKDKKRSEKSRAITMEVTGIQNLLAEARKDLNEEQSAILQDFNHTLSSTEDENEKISAYKSLSSTWFGIGRKDIAGFYAEEVAKRDSTAEAWSIAGTTYSLAVQGSEDNTIREWSSKRAVNAFEQSISIDPNNVDSKINLALTYVDNPLSSNPMKGILMLRDLNQNDPENVKVINQLARLAIRTNQFERAIERLKKAITIEPKNKTSNCLLAQALSQSGNEAEAVIYQKNCTNF